MKSLSVLVACFAATIVGVSACANPTDSGKAQQQGGADIVASVQQDNDIAATLPDDVKASGRITVSINPDVEPIKFLDANGKISGLNPDLLRAAAKVLGIEAEFHEGTFDSMVPGLEAKRYNVIASVGDFVERQKKIDFIDYLKTGTGILSSTSVDRTVSSPNELCGLKVGHSRGTAQQGYLEAAAKACKAAGKAPLETRPYGDGAAGILAVKSGQDDAYWGDLPAMLYNVQQNPKTFKILYQEQKSVYGIGINKEDTELRDAVRAALLKLAQDGVYDKLLKQWAQEGYGLPEFPMNANISLKK